MRGYAGTYVCYCKRAFSPSVRQSNDQDYSTQFYTKPLSRKALEQGLNGYAMSKGCPTSPRRVYLRPINIHPPVHVSVGSGVSS